MSGWSSRLFDLFMLPLEAGGLGARRREYLPLAEGDVLEIGAGTGVNLPYYRFDRIRSLTVTDLELDRPTIRRRIREAGNGSLRVPVSMREADVQQLPFASESFDTVVFTLIFCSVPDPEVGAPGSAPGAASGRAGRIHRARPARSSGPRGAAAADHAALEEDRRRLPFRPGYRLGHRAGRD